VTAIRVFILTTDGPVEVQRITAEDPGVKSVICLDGKAVALPVSPAYEAFVRSPTGVIESCFGHPAYRLDVSGRISEGLSWQFGVFLAHALNNTGRLGGEGADVAVLTTGEVDHDLNVLPVEAVSEKLMLAEPLVNELVAGGVATTVLIPQDNNASDAGGVSLAPVATVAQAFRILGLDAPEKSVPAHIATAAATPRRSAVPLLTIFALLVVGATVSWWLVERDRAPVASAPSTTPIIPVASVAKPPPPVAKPPPPKTDLVTTVIETRAPAGKSCAAVHFDKVQPRIVEASVANTGRFADSRARGLCGLSYRIVNKGAPVDLTVLAARGAQGVPAMQTKIFVRNQRLEKGSEASLNVTPPRSATPLRYQFLLLAETDLNRAAPAGVDPLPAEITVDRWRAIPAALVRDGLTVHRVTHNLAP